MMEYSFDMLEREIGIHEKRIDFSLLEYFDPSKCFK